MIKKVQFLILSFSFLNSLVAEDSFNQYHSQSYGYPEQSNYPLGNGQFYSGQVVQPESGYQQIGNSESYPSYGGQYNSYPTEAVQNYVAPQYGNQGYPVQNYNESYSSPMDGYTSRYGQYDTPPQATGSSNYPSPYASSGDVPYNQMPQTNDSASNPAQYGNYSSYDSNKEEYAYPQLDNGPYNFSSPYSSERYDGQTYPYTSQNGQYDSEGEEVSGDRTHPMLSKNAEYESDRNYPKQAASADKYEGYYIPQQDKAQMQSPNYRAENDPPLYGMKSWQNGERMATMPEGEEGADPNKEYADPNCPNRFYRFEPEYSNEWHCENETRYCYKRHCRYVPQYYQKRCCVYVPQYYYVTRVAYVPEYYYSAKRYEVPNYYAVPKCKYVKRYYYRSDCDECQYLDPDDSECVYSPAYTKTCCGR